MKTAWHSDRKIKANLCITKNAKTLSQRIFLTPILFTHLTFGHSVWQTLFMVTGARMIKDTLTEAGMMN